MKRQIGFVFMLALIIYACKHDVVNPVVTTPIDTTGGNGGDTTGGNNNGMVCFQTEILPIFTTNCALGGCHNTTSHQEGYILDSYENITTTGDDDGIVAGDPEESEIYEMITEDDPEKRMPLGKAPLSKTDKDLIKKWIKEGAKNTTCTQECNPNLFTFSGAVLPIINKYCKNCHLEPATANKPNFANYAGIKAVALDKGRLVGAINHAVGFTPMPQAGPKLSDCNITQITKWVAAGAPEN